MRHPVSIHLLTGATVEAVLAELPTTGLALLYKHSHRCGISLLAREELEAFGVNRPDVPIFQLDVLAQRQLSRTLSTLLGLPHASPQAILLRDRLPVWSATHSRITALALTAAAADNPETPSSDRAP